MKKWLFTGLMLFLIALTGCTATIYGVPQEHWDAMGEQERVAAMEAYQARQAALRQHARHLALESERQRAIAAEEARQRQLRVDAVYRGEGVYGDLLRVTIRDGRLKLHGSHRAYQPVAFRIAAGESKEVGVVDLKGRRATMVVSYDGSILLLDESPGDRRSRASRLVYEDAWEEGKTYPLAAAKGPLELRGVTVTVQVLGEPPRDRRAGRRPQVIVIKEKEQRPQRPEAVVVKEHPARNQPADSPPSRVKVTFNRGQIRIRGKRCPITPQTIDLREGQTRTVALQGKLGKVKVRVAYQGGELAIDDHPGKGPAATRLGFSREWRTGSTYRIEATESRLVEDLDISVLAI